MHPDSTSLSRKATLKNWITNGLYQTGMLRAFHNFSQSYELAAEGAESGRLRRVHKAKYLVLGYHRVGTEGPPLYSTLPQAAFAAQMRYIKRRYRVISVREMAAELQDPNAQGQAVAVTFDDGYAGTFTEAFPVLHDYGVPASVYLTGDAIESGQIPWYDRIFLRFQRAEPVLRLVLDDPHTFELRSRTARLDAAEKVVMYLRTLPDEERRTWCAELERMLPLRTDDLLGAMLTWEQIRKMQRGGITFGAHTMTHPVISRLSSELVHEEVWNSKRLIEQRLNTAVDEFAYPFGKSRDCGTTATATLKQLGFTTALTTIVGINQPGGSLYRLRRLVVDNDTSIARFALQLHRLFFHPIDEEQLASAVA
jgi:peptidoglycan/xylan/chitin deacetylase (PgdA/CDA1 family)